MKNLKRMLLLVLILIGSNVIEAYSTVVISIYLARHRDCQGFGICKIKIGDEAPMANLARGRLDLNSENQLVLSLSKKSDLSAEAYDKYFSKGVFVCEDDFPVPSDVLKALGYSGSYTIKAGTYPVTLKGDLITVVF
jgi:hypothetical protein